jgi:hypothetical protein
MDSWPPRKIIGEHIERYRSQKQKESGPEQPRMMNAPPFALMNRRLWCAFMTICFIHPFPYLFSNKVQQFQATVRTQDGR